MPPTVVLFFAETDGTVPLMQWLADQPAKVQDKCTIKMERLAAMGHDLRRPDADLLRDGIHELRVRYRHVNYRMLYFFHEGRAVLTHGLTKEAAVPAREIDLALRRKAAFEKDPAKHTHRET